jgi:hypothetical protein
MPISLPRKNGRLRLAAGVSLQEEVTRRPSLSPFLKSNECTGGFPHDDHVGFRPMEIPIMPNHSHFVRPLGETPFFAVLAPDTNKPEKYCHESRK